MRRFLFVSIPCVLFVLSIGLSGQTLKHRPGKSETPVPAHSKPSISLQVASGTPLKITASSSSQRLAVQANTYYPANAIDGKRSTAWIEGVDGPGRKNPGIRAGRGPPAPLTGTGPVRAASGGGPAMRCETREDLPLVADAPDVRQQPRIRWG